MGYEFLPLDLISQVRLMDGPSKPFVYTELLMDYCPTNLLSGFQPNSLHSQSSANETELNRHFEKNIIVTQCVFKVTFKK